MTFDISSLDLLPERHSDPLSDLPDLGLQHCSDITCQLRSCTGISCWITI
jgi:hypothetical protein